MQRRDFLKAATGMALCLAVRIEAVLGANYLRVLRQAMDV